MESKKTDRLGEMFEQQEDFMRLLKEHRDFPDWPVDITLKSSQQLSRDIVHSAQEELHESLRNLKNWKAHRATEIPAVDRDEFLEEVVDAQHYIFELILLTGFTPEEFFEAYMKKGEINVKRILGGY